MSELDQLTRREELEEIGLDLRESIDGRIRKRKTRRRAITALASVALLGAVAIGAIAAVSGSDDSDVTPAAATVLERATKAANELQLPQPGEYTYVEDATTTLLHWRVAGNEFHYQWQTNKEVWVAPDASGITRFSAPVGPTFATDAERASWINLGSPGLKNPAYVATYDALKKFGSPESVHKKDWFRAVPFLPEFGEAAPDPGLSADLLKSYGISVRRLIALAPRQVAFDRYVRRHVEAALHDLYKGTFNGQELEVEVEQRSNTEVFGLTLDALSSLPQARRPKLKRALLRLAGTTGRGKVELNVKDRLGRPGISLKSKGVRAIFDPKTYLLLESRRPGGAGSTVDVEIENRRVATVDALRKRPDGTTVAPYAK